MSIENNPENANVTKVSIDGKEYNAADLSETVKAQIVSMRMADQELERLKQQSAMIQTARNAYALALKEELG